MRITFVVLVLNVGFCLGVSPVHAKRAPGEVRGQDPREIFARGNSFYEAGQYEKAIGEYEKLLQRGYRGGNLFYNLGNAYFKLDQKGRAILYYKKALKLQPRDQDIKSNIDFALSLVEDNIKPSPRSWAANQWNKLVSSFNMRELAIAAVVMFWLLFAVLIVFVYANRWRRILLRVAGILLVLFFVVVAGALSRAYLDGEKEAVVLTKEVKVHYGPSADDVVAFILHEGAVVRVENVKADWYLIGLPDGKSGWLKKSSCELV
jgi:tetratricopeptide (TPR) repeat protein